MAILWRSWLTFSVVIFIVLLVSAGLAILQHDAVLSGLIRQRVSVVAQTTGAAFRPIVDLGLPLSMVRNGADILRRSRETDPRIAAIRLFNPSGIVVYTTLDNKPEQLGREILDAQRLSDGPVWSLETVDELDSGYTILNRAGTVVGGVLVSYPKDALVAAADEMIRTTITTALALWAVFSALSFLVLRVALASPIRGLVRLERLSRAEWAGVGAGDSGPDRGAHVGRGLLRGEIDNLVTHLTAADRGFAALEGELRALESDLPERPADARSHPEPSPVVVGQTPETSLARHMARRLVPWAAILLMLATMIFAGLTMRAVGRSIEPEFAAREALIGTVVSGNVQHAVSAGIPLEGLAGAERYFGELLAHLPEVAYVAVATDRIVLETGSRTGSPAAAAGTRGDAPGHPIVYDGEEIGRVVVEMDPAFVTRRFFNVFLDLGVVVLVTIMLAFEVLILMLGRSLTGPLDRLHHLVTLQAAGNFSKRVAAGARDAVGAITTKLVERAVALNCAYARIDAALAARPTLGDLAARLGALGRKHGLSAAGPARLIFPYFTDIRLALFLFAAADSLPLSFMPIYTRAADNPWPWLDENVLISLPIAGYVLAIIAASPFARELAGRFGHRRVLLAATVPALVGHLGLSLATSALEIVIFRTLTGLGYAVLTLVCQDYVIDVSAPHQRDRALAVFTMVLFGGIFCGTALGGVLGDRLGRSTVFLISAGLVVIAAILILRLLSARWQAAASKGKVRLVPPLAAPLRSLRFVGLVLGIAIPANVLLQAYVTYLAALVLDSLGASSGDIGRMVMTYFVLVGLASPVAARIAQERVPAPVLALAGAALSGAALVPAVVWPSQLTMLLGLSLAGAGHALVRGPAVSVAMAIAETDLADLGINPVLAALRTFERAGSVIGLLGVAAVAGTFGYQTAIATVAGWVLLGAVLFLVASGSHGLSVKPAAG